MNHKIWLGCFKSRVRGVWVRVIKEGSMQQGKGSGWLYVHVIRGCVCVCIIHIG